MSTRTRIVLLSPGDCYYGPFAVRQLARVTTPFTIQEKQKMAGKKKLEILKALGERLPEGWTLTLVQEPRNTRKNRSIYWNIREQKGGLK